MRHRGLNPQPDNDAIITFHACCGTPSPHRLLPCDSFGRCEPETAQLILKVGDVGRREVQHRPLLHPSFLSMSVQCRFNVRSMSVQCPFNVGSMSVQCPFNVGSVSVQCPFNVGSVSVQCPFNVGSMSVQCPFNVGSMSVQCPFNVRSMSVQCPFNVGSMSVLLFPVIFSKTA